MLFVSGLAMSVQSRTPWAISIKVLPESSRVIVKGSTGPTTVWSFADVSAGVVGLGSRIKNLELSDAKGTRIDVQQIAPGQFHSSTPASSFTYEVDLAASSTSGTTLVSWLNADRGVLMPGDLLPLQFPTYILIHVDAPQGWTIYSAGRKKSETDFEIDDSNRSALVLGKNLRASTRSAANTVLTLVTQGEWAFPDNEAIDLAARILKAHSDIAGPVPCDQTLVTVLPFLNAGASARWNARTSGCSVSLLMGKQPSRVGALSQLGNALTHELFHLWIPNGLTLEGEYDWFYEGFTVYHAANMAVRLDLLTFSDLMDAIGRANDASSSAADSSQVSLIEASRRRWSSGAAAVYSKAMVLAFLYDLNLRYQSKGKRSLDDVYRTIFRVQKGLTTKSEGNAVVIGALNSVSGSPVFVTRFVTQPANIDLKTELAPFGLRVEKFGSRPRIVVGEKLTSRQRDLLRELGYNDRTR